MGRVLLVAIATALFLAFLAQHGDLVTPFVGITVLVVGLLWFLFRVGRRTS